MVTAIRIKKKLFSLIEIFPSNFGYGKSLNKEFQFSHASDQGLN
jgi:hypothetical protein